MHLFVQVDFDMRSFVENPTGCTTYDLVAVFNHYGATSGSGHYTAFARSSIDGQWYEVRTLLLALSFIFSRMPHIV